MGFVLGYNIRHTPLQNIDVNLIGTESMPGQEVEIKLIGKTYKGIIK